MNEHEIRNQIDESLLYYKKCKRRHQIISPFYFIVIILTLACILFVITIYAIIYFEAIKLALTWVEPDSDAITLYLMHKYEDFIKVEYLIYLLLPGAIVLSIFKKLNKKAYLRNENKVFTLKKDLKKLEEEKSHSQ